MSSGRSTLLPGYHQVGRFDDDDEYERDENGNIIEEVEYVTLDIGVVEPTLVPSTTSYRLIGLDTPNPYLQLSGTIFKGTHQELLGTELFFTEARDEADPSRKSFAHFANTEKRIRFREIELREKKSTDVQTHRSTSAPLHEASSSSASAKKRQPQSVEELVGQEPSDFTPRGKRSRRGRGKRKSMRKAPGNSEVPAIGAEGEVVVTEPPAEDSFAEAMDTT